MHDIEPYYKWRDFYIASEDERSPFFGRTYSEFTFSNRVYNYMIHPQWDEFGSPTLYGKILYVNYDVDFAVIELIGEWNDCITNDIMFLKRNIIDQLQREGIRKFVLICENVLNFHGDEDVYYEEWWEEAMDEEGWVVMVNLLEHVEREMVETQLDNYLYLGDEFNDFSWRKWLPPLLLPKIEDMIDSREKRIL